MSVMDDMLAWLTTTLDLVEHRALASKGDGEGAWTNACQHDGAGTIPPAHDLCAVVTGGIHIYDEGGHDADDAAHIALHDPRAVLARVTAERAILAEIASSTAQYPDFDGGTVNGLENAAMLIAWGHRHDAPEFLEEWAPPTVEVTT